MIYIIVGAAGILGALLRYGIGLLVVQAGLDTVWGTLPINWAGSFILAGFLCYAETSRRGVHPWVKAGFGTGFLGAFTTFSTFSMETVRMLQDGAYGGAVLYITASLVGGLAFAWLGWTISKRFILGRQTEGGKS